jgi:hypothetical protein
MEFLMWFLINILEIFIIIFFINTMSKTSFNFYSVIIISLILALSRIFIDSSILILIISQVIIFSYLRFINRLESILIIKYLLIISIGCILFDSICGLLLFIISHKFIDDIRYTYLWFPLCLIIALSKLLVFSMFYQRRNFREKSI